MERCVVESAYIQCTCCGDCDWCDRYRVALYEMHQTFWWAAAQVLKKSKHSHGRYHKRLGTRLGWLVKGLVAYVVLACAGCWFNSLQYFIIISHDMMPPFYIYTKTGKSELPMSPEIKSFFSFCSTHHWKSYSLHNSLYTCCRVQHTHCGMYSIDPANVEDVVFNTLQWIQCGQTYKNVPLYVCEALKTFWKIPECYGTGEK